MKTANIKSWIRRASAGAAAALLSFAAAAAKDPQVTAVPGKPVLLLGDYELKDIGYTEQEFFLSGEATSYTLAGPPPEDGKWNAQPSERAAYTTRIVVVQPADSRRFNGSVVVEWLNVSGGVDGAADWMMAHREMVREGYAYVGVSAQKVGIEGGANMMGTDGSLKKVDPARYGRLHHPGDQYSYDIYSQAGRVVRASKPGGVLGPLKPKRVIAVGESQSAAFMTTYVNAVDPLAKVYDGFLIHSRVGNAAPLAGTSIFAPSSGRPQRIRLRPDLRAPVLTFITETDLIGLLGSGFYEVRQPDTDRMRAWEVPGTAHADNYTFMVNRIDTGHAPLEKLAAAYAPTADLMGVMKAPKPINFAPQHHYVLQAALFGLDRWIRTGEAPPTAPPIGLADGNPPNVTLDANGLATGGVRTPWVDVPAARLSGVATTNSHLLGLIVGSGEPFSQETLATLYPGGKADYLKRFEASLDATIQAGFIRPADRAEILGLAALMYPGAN